MAVSKALRDAPDISQATKAKVKEEAERIHYLPNQAARRLRSRNSMLLGVVVPQIHHPYFSNLVWGIERQACELGYQILLAHSLDSGDVELREVRRLLAHRVDGLLLVPAARWQHRLATLEMLRDAAVPAVLLDRYPAGAHQFAKVSWMVNQDRQGAECATRHLMDLGHRDIICLAGPHGSSASAARLEGYRRTMDEEVGTGCDAKVFLAGHGIEGGSKAMSQALAERARCTGIVAFSDSVAFGAIELLLSQGIRVPDDVSVVGFGDSLMAKHFRVPLTTLRIPVADMGAAAVHALLNLIGGNSVDPREMPVELVIRETTAAPGAGLGWNLE